MRGGLALVLVTGILGLLAVMATGFVTLAQLDRRGTLQRVYGTKAVLLARSGMEDAVARLSARQDPARLTCRFRGEDWNGDGLLNAGPETSGQVLAPARLDVLNCPVGLALRPSFFHETLPQGAGDPWLVEVAGRSRGYSGALQGDRVAEGNLYALKVEDESAKINVNGGILDRLNRDTDIYLDHRDPDVVVAGKPVGWNGKLARMLSILATELGLPGATTFGVRVLQFRPAGGYASVAALQQTLGVTSDLSPWLTVSSWVDPKVVQPTATTGTSISIGNIQTLKRQRGRLTLCLGGRPPINLNAAPREVLLTMVSGLGAWACHDPYPASYLPRAQDLFLASIPGAEIGVADAILARRDAEPFSGWNDFDRFCEALTGGILSGREGQACIGGNLGYADLLKAAFNPNTRLNKQIPDLAMFQWVDKSDLNQWSTEASLGPTGIFRIASCGRVRGAGGLLLAERTVQESVQVFTLTRHTTQADFVAGRTLSDAPAYLSRAALGHRTHGAGASWNPGGQGLAVVTYPAAQTALPAAACDVDGAVALATVEIPHVNPIAPAGAALMFLHHFDDSWDSEDLAALRGASHPFARIPSGTAGDDARLQVNLAQDIWPQSTGAVSTDPATFYPDGFHVQDLCCPRFLGCDASGTQYNFPPSDDPADPGPSDHGFIAAWVKPTNPINPGNGTTYYQACFSARRQTSPSLTQVLKMGFFSTGFGAIVENKAVVEAGMGGGDGPYEAQSAVDWVRPIGVPATNPCPVPGHRWLCVGLRFDTDASNFPTRVVQASLADWQGVRVGVSNIGPWTYSPNPAASEKLFGPGSTFILGTDALPFPPSNVAAAPGKPNQVMDEFAIYDLLDHYATAQSGAVDLLGALRIDGRYYKGEDGVFLSAALEPNRGGYCRLLGMDWTAVLPTEVSRTSSVDTAWQTPIQGIPKALDPALSGCGIDLELADDAGIVLGTLVRGTPLGLSLGRFRYRARFRTGITQPLLEGAHETPWLDDVTAVWQPMTGPRVLARDR